MFHDESCKPVYCAVTRSKVKVKSQKNIAGVCFLHCCELVFTLKLLKLLILCTEQYYM